MTDQAPVARDRRRFMRRRTDVIAHLRGDHPDLYDATLESDPKVAAGLAVLLAVFVLGLVAGALLARFL